MNKIRTLFVVSFFMVIEVSAQKIIMEKIQMVEGMIEVYYTLEDTNPLQEYKVDLYSSKDNFAVPLTKVSGNVGTEVKPGEFLIISWNAFEEIGGHYGELFLEIRARVYIPFVRITGFDEGAKFKRGKTYPLLWTSGNRGGQIDIDLYRDQSRISGDRNVPNSGKYEYVIPGSVKAGTYQLKFTNTRNRDKFTYTRIFQDSSKTTLRS